MRFMLAENRVRVLSRVDAVASWIVALPGLVDPSRVSMAFDAEEPEGTVVVLLCSVFVFLLGAAAWYAGGAARTRGFLLRGLWIGKAALGASITVAHLAGWAPPAAIGLNLLVNLVWVPAYMYFDAASSRRSLA